MKKSWYIINKAESGPVEISIYDEIGFWGVTAKDFIRDLSDIDESAEITLRIHSPGGSILDGNAIFNALKRHKGEITVQIDGLCASMATVIAMVGKTVKMAENGFFMIHNPSTFTGGDSDDMRRMADVLDKMKKGIISAYQSRSNLSESEIESLMDEETWMTAEEAKDHGFVDEVTEKIEADDAKNFDLSKFKNAAKISNHENTKSKGAGETGGNSGAVHWRDLEAVTIKPNFKNMKRKRFFMLAPDNGENLPVPSQKEIEAKAQELAAKLFKEKMAKHKEIDDLVLAIRKRDKRDFAELAATAKQEDWTVDKFRAELLTSDQFKPFEIEMRGSQIEVFGERATAKLTPGETFVGSDSFKNLAHKTGTRRSVSVECSDFRNATTTSGLTSIQKQDGVVMLGLQRLTVRDLLAPGSTDKSTIRYIKEDSHTNAATTVAEGNQKPEASFSFSEVDASVKKIAAFTKISDELMQDQAAVASAINARLPFMVQQTEEAQLLNGNGEGSNLVGILQTGGIQTQAKGGDTAADALYKALTKIRTIGFFEPDAYVIHPNDWEQLRLSKDGNNQYYAGGPFMGQYGVGGFALDFIWGKKVVVTTAISEGTALAGAFYLGAQYFQRTGLTLEATNSNEDDFEKNLITLRAEERLALAVYRPKAFCTITGI